MYVLLDISAFFHLGRFFMSTPAHVVKGQQGNQTAPTEHATTEGLNTQNNTPKPSPLKTEKDPLAAPAKNAVHAACHIDLGGEFKELRDGIAQQNPGMDPNICARMALTMVVNRRAERAMDELLKKNDPALAGKTPEQLANAIANAMGERIATSKEGRAAGLTPTADDKSLVADQVRGHFAAIQRAAAGATVPQPGTTVDPNTDKLTQALSAQFKQALLDRGLSAEDADKLLSGLAAKLSKPETANDPKLKEDLIDAITALDGKPDANISRMTAIEKLAGDMLASVNGRMMAGGVLSDSLDNLVSGAMAPLQTIDAATNKPVGYAEAVLDTYKKVVAELSANGQLTEDQQKEIAEAVAKKFEDAAMAAGAILEPGETLGLIQSYNDKTKLVMSGNFEEIAKAIHGEGATIAQMNAIKAQLVDAEGKFDPTKVEAFVAEMLKAEAAAKAGPAAPPAGPEDAPATSFSDLMAQIGGNGPEAKGSLLGAGLRAKIDLSNPEQGMADQIGLDTLYALWLLDKRGPEACARFLAQSAKDHPDRAQALPTVDGLQKVLNGDPEAKDANGQPAPTKGIKNSQEELAQIANYVTQLETRLTGAASN